MTLNITKSCHYVECHYAEHCILLIVVLNVSMLNVIMLSIAAPRIVQRLLARLKPTYVDHEMVGWFKASLGQGTLNEGEGSVQLTPLH
jgi:hypothetical protein